MASTVEGIPEIKKNLRLYREAVFGEAVGIMEATFAHGAEQARARAPWTDRTTVARTSIDSKVIVKMFKNIIGVLGIGAEYGIWLELSHGGKYRIIRPTLKVLQEIINTEFRKIKITLRAR